MKNFTDIKDISKSDIADILTRTKNEKRSIKENGIQAIERVFGQLALQRKKTKERWLKKQVKI